MAASEQQQQQPVSSSESQSAPQQHPTLFGSGESEITKSLRIKFDSGLQSTSAPFHQQIQETADELNISVKKVKCGWADNLQNVDICFIAIHSNETYVGGTSKGQEWLKGNPALPLSFLSHVNKSRVFPSPKAPVKRKDLKEAVERLLRNKYSLTVGDAMSRVPYTNLTKRHVHLRDKEFLLKSPSVMTMKELLFIKDNIQEITFVDVPPTTAGLSGLPIDHTYSQAPRTSCGQETNNNSTVGSSHLTTLNSSSDDIPIVFSCV